MHEAADNGAPEAAHLRTMLAVAAALRLLARDASVADASLYLAAAGALARRAARLAGILPEPQTVQETMVRTGLHRPVDMRI